MILTKPNRVTDAAYDKLMGIYRRHNHVFAAAFAVGTLRKLCKAHGINPDQ